jgi:hypothetical protein
VEVEIAARGLDVEIHRPARATWGSCNSMTRKAKCDTNSLLPSPLLFLRADTVGNALRVAFAARRLGALTSKDCLTERNAG